VSAERDEGREIGYYLAVLVPPYYHLRGDAMSWSRQFSGNPNTVRDDVGGLADSLRRDDEKLGATDAAQNAHGRQARSVSAAVERFIDGIPADRTLEVSASGHANDDGTGSVSISIQENL
jgi:hypothetical protein